MSHPLLPKNLNKDNALFRQGKPDYTKLEAAAFPIPTVDEAGAILENSDTGDRYRWTGTVWVQVVTAGSQNTFILSEPKDFYLEAVRGSIPGISTAIINGENRNTTSTTQDLWTEGGTLVYPTAGESWEIVSTNNNDTLGGTGLESVFIEYLDTDFVVQTELVNLNGTTPVATVASDHFRLVEFTGVVAGSNGSNIGAVRLRVAGGGNVRAKMEIGSNRSFSSHFTVPKDTRAYGVLYLQTAAKGQDITYKVIVRPVLTGLFTELLVAPMYEGVFSTGLIMPTGPFLAGADLKLTVSSGNQSTTSTAVQQYIIEDTTI